MANERGWLRSEELGCWLGNWEGTFLRLPGTWLRCFDQEGRLWLTSKEKEQQQSEQEHARAEAAEKELATLKARLAELEKQ